MRQSGLRPEESESTIDAKNGGRDNVVIYFEDIEWQFFFRCETAGCTRGFVAKQGSRRRYCDECLAKRRRLGKGRPRKEKNEHTDTETD